MSLNIKNPEAHELAAEVARLTGTSLTAAVTEALREKLERVRRERGDPELVADLRRIAHEIATHAPGLKSSDIDDLYDELGLPK